MDNKKENTKENKKSCKGVVKIIIAVVLTAVITYFATINITLKSYLNSSNTAYLATKLSLIKNKLNKLRKCKISKDKEQSYARICSSRSRNYRIRSI